MENINEYILKITGGVTLSERLDPSLTVNILAGELDIYETSKKDNQDGTFDICYKGKFSSGIEISQGNKVVRGRDKTSESKKTRFTIMSLASEFGEDRNGFYQRFQEKLRKNIYQVHELLEKL